MRNTLIYEPLLRREWSATEKQQQEACPIDDMARYEVVDQEYSARAVHFVGPCPQQIAFFSAGAAWHRTKSTLSERAEATTSETVERRRTIGRRVVAGVA